MPGSVDLGEGDDVDPELVDTPVLDTAAELPAVRSRRTTAEHGAEAAVAVRLDRPDEIGGHLEPARRAAAPRPSRRASAPSRRPWCGRRRRARSASRGRPLVGRQCRFAEREHGEDADARPTSASDRRRTTASHAPSAAAQELADLRVVGARHVLREHGDVVDEQAAAWVADRLRARREALLADGRRRLRRDAVDEPGDAREDDPAADDERDEHVRSARSIPSARRSGRARAAGCRRRISHRPAGSAGGARSSWRELAQDEAGGETDLGDEHDQAEEQRAVPLPPVQRHDHVAQRPASRVPMPASHAMVFMRRLLLHRW